ncbi:MAG: DNA recombination protein RmuC [Chitinophagales bacterium]|nr:DNA recombination protein RmuC [Chitinophagales bacterium]
MESIVYLIIGIIFGGVAIWIIRKSQFEKDHVTKVFHDDVMHKLMQSENKTTFLDEKIQSFQTEMEKNEMKMKEIISEKDHLSIAHATVKTSFELLQKDMEESKSKTVLHESELQNRLTEIENLKDHLMKFKTKNDVLEEKQLILKKEMEELGTKFTSQFKVLANEILEDKSKRFTEENQKNMKQILDPLNVDLKEFKKKVEETYEKENKQRFSLEEKIKELVGLNQKISEEANNLTRALKGQVKKQGDWGEMILENILQQSGLTEGREYFKQGFLRDDAGATLINEEGRKMQPDFIIQYPDKRKVIIDSKVSLNAYERYNATDEADEQKREMQNHLNAIYGHIEDLHKRNYEKYTASLDFVMMFVPIEPAYLLAMQKDADLWNYAYKKRVLIISPTNLIAAIKLISELWKKDDQNKNAMAIAERGGALYDKFVSFAENLLSVGRNINDTQKSYTEAMKQLTDGSGNLVGQVEKLKRLGVNTKKSIPGQLLNEALLDDDD